MMEPSSNPQLIDTERRLIPDERRRRVMCKPTDFSVFKTPALLIRVELPIVLSLESGRFSGVLNKIYLDGYDAQLDIPTRSASQFQRLEPSATDLIGAIGTLKKREKNEPALLENQASVQITIARRINKKAVLIRIKDLSLQEGLYAKRLALLLAKESASAGPEY
ncbi:MAG: hypothetical protein PsegKO_34190 [Pseudohongiellaceae bacterium]